jgi:N-acetylmuramoyl-L-alanine amidase
MKKYWLIDAGHGGVDKEGKYTTAPAKMFVFSDGYTICEGIVNRAIAKYLQELLHQAGIDFGIVYHEFEDWSLKKRSDMVNSVFDKNSNSVCLSIHSNSAPVAGTGRGNEVYTCIGSTPADAMADIFAKNYISLLPQFLFRKASPHSNVKKARFYMVGYTDLSTGKWKGPKCPSILVESLFFDNRQEAEYLNSEKGQRQIANLLFQSINEIQNSTL